MPNIPIISDTGHNLPGYIKRDIHMIEVPFLLYVHGESIPDNSLTLKELAERLEVGKKGYPTTSAPPAGSFVDAYKVSSDADGILVVTISSDVSATYDSAKLAIEIFRSSTGKKVPIELVDSRGGTMTQGFLIQEAHKMIKSGLKLEEVADNLRNLTKKLGLVFTAHETTYLYRSNRIKGIEHFTASILNFRPIIALVDGKPVPVGKTRGDQKAIEQVAKEVIRRSGGRIKKIAVIGGLDTEERENKLESEILRRLDVSPKQVVRAEMCPAIMIHMGPHPVGAAWLEE